LITGTVVLCSLHSYLWHCHGVARVNDTPIYSGQRDQGAWKAWFRR